MAGMPEPTNRLHPLMHAVTEGGYYQPSPLRPPVRDDAAYVGEGFQRYMSPERKASGFFGNLGMPGAAIGEFSLGGQPPAPMKQLPAGQAFTYPSIFEGITKQGLMSVLGEAAGGPRFPQSVADQARAAAQERMAQGKSPFWNPQQDYLFQGMK